MFNNYEGFTINTAYMFHIDVKEDTEQGDGSYIVFARMMSGMRLIIKDCLLKEEAEIVAERLLANHKELSRDGDKLINTSRRELFYVEPVRGKQKLQNTENLSKFDGFGLASGKDDTAIIGFCQSGNVMIETVPNGLEEQRIKEITKAVNDFIKLIKE